MIRRLLARLGVGSLGGGAVTTATALFIRAGLQALSLVLLSRWMGATGYGAFAGVIAIVMLLAPLAGWGASTLVARRIATDVTPAHAWGEALAKVVLISVLMIGALFAWRLMPGARHASAETLFFIALAELLLVPLSIVSAAASLATGRHLLAAWSICLIPLARLAVLAGAVWLGMNGTPETVARLHMIGSLAGALLVIFATAKQVGGPIWVGWKNLHTSLPEGSQYAGGQLLATGYQEIDKALLFSIAGAAILGPYAAAFRVASMFALPIAALASVMLPRLFLATARDISARPLIRAGLITACAYGLIAVLGVVAVSPLLPLLLGNSFVASSDYLLWLAPWPLFYAIHHVAATTLTGLGKQRERLAIELLGIIVVIAGVTTFATTLGAISAVTALLVAEVIMCGLCLWRIRTRVK